MTFSELRLEIYANFSWPDFLAGTFRRNGLLVSMITTLSVAVVVLLVFVFQGPGVVFATHLGENAFYKVIP
jgi:citrate/tricarballylate utilization protein